MRTLTDTRLIGHAITRIALACVGPDLIDAPAVATARRIQLAFVDILNEGQARTHLVDDAFPLTFTRVASDGLIPCNTRPAARIRAIRCSLIGSRQ